MGGRAQTYLYGGIRAPQLVLRWAAFFDVVGWRWSYRSHDLGGYAPMFRVEIPALDSAWAHAVDSSKIEHVIAGARGELEHARLEGYAVALGASILSREVLGAVASYPRPTWRPLRGAEAGVADLVAAWRESADQLATCAVPEPVVTPEVYGGTTLPDWRSRGEVLARRWGTPEQSRDWGLLIAEIGQIDQLVAGVLAGVSRGRLTDETLDVWLPVASIRTAVLRALGSRPRQVVEQRFHVALQVLLEDGG